MKQQLGFYVNLDGCTGCNACVLACKDKNNLPSGILWRRVSEKEGGGLARLGHGFITNVYVFYSSISCNHCEHPPCITGCPTDALVKRADNGLVILDSTECTGCKQCLSLCPTASLRYHEAESVVCKCNGCPDLLAVGEKPACVAACPMRTLDFGFLEQLRHKYPYALSYDVLEPGLKEAKPALLVALHRCQQECC